MTRPVLHLAALFSAFCLPPPFDQPWHHSVFLCAGEALEQAKHSAQETATQAKHSAQETATKAKH